MTHSSDHDEVQSYIQDLLRESPAPDPTPSLPGTSPLAKPQTLHVSPTGVEPAVHTLVHAEPLTDDPKLSCQRRAALERLLLTRLGADSPRRDPPQTASSPACESPSGAPDSGAATVVDTGVPPRPSIVAEELSGEWLCWHDNGRPGWAQGPFEALLFEVSGLTLAVPLVVLGQIHTLNSELTKVFGQADWFMGLQPAGTGSIRCVNTALFVMPERYDEKFIETAKYVISIAGMDWGLAVDRVRQPMTIDPDEVTWRTERAKRPWLAGTVKSAMCALLDLPRMGAILQTSDLKRRQ